MAQDTTRHEDHGHENVPIYMNDKEFTIHRGHRTVAEIKSVCGVNPTWVIEQIGADGAPTIVDDSASITIKGKERFISHVRGGGSS